MVMNHEFTNQSRNLCNKFPSYIAFFPQNSSILISWLYLANLSDLDKNVHEPFLLHRRPQGQDSVMRQPAVSTVNGYPITRRACLPVREKAGNTQWLVPIPAETIKLGRLSHWIPEYDRQEYRNDSYPETICFQSTTVNKALFREL